MNLNLELLEPRDTPSVTAWLDTAGVLRVRGDGCGHVIRIATVGGGNATGHDDSDLVRIYVDDSDAPISVPVPPAGVDGNARLGSTVQRIEYHTSGPGSWITLDDSLGDTPVAVVSSKKSKDRITAEAANVSVFAQKNDWLEGVFVDAPKKYKK